jgi:hypothetical protein
MYLRTSPNMFPIDGQRERTPWVCRHACQAHQGWAAMLVADDRESPELGTLKAENNGTYCERAFSYFPQW